MKKILILGSNSYLGSSFVRYMQDKNITYICSVDRNFYHKDFYLLK